MDFFDGLVLKALIERLSGQTISMPAGEFVQSEERIRKNLNHILERIDEIIGIKEGERKCVKINYETKGTFGKEHADIKDVFLLIKH